jgi:hypothetical protein
MEIRIKETGAVVFESELRGLYPNVSGPLDDLYDVVFEGPQAQPTRYQVAFRNGVEQVNGKWYTKYSVAEMSDDVKASKDTEQAKAVRAQRDAKLAATDWMVVKAVETGSAVPVETATARQALRDITSQVGFPWEITWPDAA